MYLKGLHLLNILNFRNCSVKGFDYVTNTCNGILLRTITGSYGSSVSIVTMLEAGRYRVLTSQGAKMFCPSKKHPDWLWYPPRLPYDGFGSCLGDTAENDYSPSSSDKVRNERSYTSTPSTCLHGVVSENFTLYLTSHC
jgi:hypothetical protein